MKTTTTLLLMSFMVLVFSNVAQAEQYSCHVQKMTVNKSAKKLEMRNVFKGQLSVNEGQARFIKKRNGKPYSYRNALFMLSRKSGTGLAELVVYLRDRDKTVVSTFNLNGGPLNFRDYSRQFSVQCQPSAMTTASLR